MPEHRARDAASVDLGLAWTWEFDAPFIRAIAAKFQERGLSVQEITPANISSVTEDVLSRRRRLRAIFDRASDEDDSFHELADFMLREHRAAPGTPGRFLNPPDDSRRAADKATMHLEFISNGIHVPYTIILSPLSEEPVVSIQADRLENLGKPFVIKPANTTGGGIGVVLNARTIEEVMA
jgi:glutathione synthase/RimK-type ligase-like ATP-grasp enzyme